MRETMFIGYQAYDGWTKCFGLEVLGCRVAAKGDDDGMEWADVTAAVMGSIKRHRHAHFLVTQQPSTLPPIQCHHHIHRLTTEK